uniref:Small ribosomal subunit protein uS10m n=1 Tax=Daphnia pulex TaxID=6669 RepID=A0A4Y7MQU4_DAPPU|nr:EOG090X0GP9 [Daphnia pulex]
MLHTFINNNKVHLVRNNLISTRLYSTSNSVNLENHSEKKDILYGSVEVEIRSGEPAVLLSYEWFASYAAKQLGITVGKCWAPQKPHHNRLTLLKSVHIYKKHRVQYEVRTYFRHMIYERLTESTLKTFLEYIQRNVPEGVSLKVSKKSFMNLPAQLTDHVPSVTLK